jgi:mannose-1-phosphate guanylyltransferase
MLFYVLDSLRAAGIRRLLINLWYQKKLIQKAVSGYARSHRMTVRFLHEPDLLGTGGALANAGPYLSEPFFIVNADSFPVGFSFKKMEASHRGLATLAVRPLGKNETFNPVGVNGKNKLVRITHTFGKGGKDHHFLGIHRLEPEALMFLPQKKKHENFNIKDFYLNMYRAGETINAFQCRNIYKGDPGIFSGYRGAHDFLLKRRGKKTYIGKEVSGLRSAKIGTGSVIGNRVMLGAGARLSRAIIFDGVTIPANACIRDAIVATSPPGNLVKSVFTHDKELPLP